jgi:glucose/arabinose dehydrogenase
MSLIRVFPAVAVFGLLVGTSAVFAQPQKDPFAEGVRPTEALTPEQERAAFHLPPGFDIQLFATEPQINKPINMAFDARGRLWVSSNVEYPYAVSKDRFDPATGRTRGSRDRIVILEDTDGDGRADKSTTFADELNIPTGVMPYGSGCIAWSIPNLWYLEDTMVTVSATSVRFFLGRSAGKKIRTETSPRTAAGWTAGFTLPTALTTLRR